MSAQHKNSGGLLANSLHNMVGDALLEVPMWLSLARPVPSVAQELTKMADKLRVPVASVTGIVRTYNKVSAFARPSATAVARDCSGRRQAHARGLRQMHVQPCAHVVRARWPHVQKPLTHACWDSDTGARVAMCCAGAGVAHEGGAAAVPRPHAPGGPQSDAGDQQAHLDAP